MAGRHRFCNSVALSRGLTHLLALAVLLAVAGTRQANAETDEALRQQLEAQKVLNEQLRKRVEQLERERAGTAPAPALEAGAPPVEEEDIDQRITAIEEALVSRGVVLLPSRSYRIVPTLEWVHDGSDAINTRSDTYRGSLTVQTGLPRGFMVGISAPYVYRDTAAGWNRGADDLTLELSKQLALESERRPSLVASLQYRHDNGDDPFDPIPIGFGFRVLTASLASVKRIDPVALYGSVSYAHVQAQRVDAVELFGEEMFSGRITPGDAWGYRIGISLAATPDITIDASLRGNFFQRGEVDSDARGEHRLPRSTTTAFSLGAGFIVTRNLSLLMVASAGATADTPDFAFSLALPYRF